MIQPHTKSLNLALRHLGRLERTHLTLAKQMLEAYGGALYGMDLLAIGALNRSTAQLTGFRLLVKSKNMICANALLRLQLDTALRFHAAFLVKQPHTFALAVLKGVHVRDLRDKNGKKMTDRHLVEALGRHYPWIPRVYERTSSYVHLSSTHILSALEPNNERNPADRSFRIKVSAKDKDLPVEMYIESVDAFSAATEVLLHYIKGWTVTKANPQLVERLRHDGPRSPVGA